MKLSPLNPPHLGKLWLVTYKKANGQTDIETVEALDPNESFIAFRNVMIKQMKGASIP
jgi:hypothetical protein